MNTLRDRIASAIRRAGYQHSYAPGPYLAGIYADAVIAELKSKPFDDFSYGPDEEGYHVDVTWVSPGAIAKMLGQTD